MDSKMSAFQKRMAEKRRERNEELVAAVKAGAVIPAVVSTQSLFFPPRPIIKKDQDALKRLYNKGD
jgi:hypothetical protein